MYNPPTRAHYYVSSGRGQGKYPIQSEAVRLYHVAQEARAATSIAEVEETRYEHIGCAALQYLGNTANTHQDLMKIVATNNSCEVTLVFYS